MPALVVNSLFVGLGGAVGAVARSLCYLVPVPEGFPYVTLAVNLVGSVLIGFIVGVAETNGLSDRGLAFLKTGVCGGFTTFSTFSLEAADLLSAGRWAVAGLYAVLSVCLCVAGVFCGRALARAMA